MHFNGGVCGDLLEPCNISLFHLQIRDKAWRTTWMNIVVVDPNASIQGTAGSKRKNKCHPLQVIVCAKDSFLAMFRLPLSQREQTNSYVANNLRFTWFNPDSEKRAFKGFPWCWLLTILTTHKTSDRNRSTTKPLRWLTLLGKVMAAWVLFFSLFW